MCVQLLGSFSPARGREGDINSQPLKPGLSDLQGPRLQQSLHKAGMRPEIASPSATRLPGPWLPSTCLPTHLPFSLYYSLLTPASSASHLCSLPPEERGSLIKRHEGPSM